jgi:hypothetical protein
MPFWFPNGRRHPTIRRRNADNGSGKIAWHFRTQDLHADASARVHAQLERIEESWNEPESSKIAWNSV